MCEREAWPSAAIDRQRMAAFLGNESAPDTPWWAMEVAALDIAERIKSFGGADRVLIYRRVREVLRCKDDPPSPPPPVIDPYAPKGGIGGEPGTDICEPPEMIAARRPR